MTDKLEFDGGCSGSHKLVTVCNRLTINSTRRRKTQSVTACYFALVAIGLLNHCTVGWSQPVRTDTTFGVAPASKPFYSGARAGAIFHCLDGSLELPGSYVNDDFCDCGDGSDEPGTAACAGTLGAQFYCSNKLSVPKRIPSSHVRDGICDCCDGTDEMGLTHLCENTCETEGSKLRNELEQKRTQTIDGMRVRQGVETQMVQTIKYWRNEHEQLDSEIAEIERERIEIQRLLNVSEQLAEKAINPIERIVFEEDFESAGLKKRWRMRKDGGPTIYRDRQRGKVLAMNSCTWGGDSFSRAGFACSPGAECKMSFWAKGAPWQGFSRGTKRTTDELNDAHSWLALPKMVDDYPDRLAWTEISSNWTYYEYEFPTADGFQMLGSDEVRFSNSQVHVMLQAHPSTGHCASTMFDDIRVVSLVQPSTESPSVDPPESESQSKASEEDEPVVSEYAKWALGMEKSATDHTSQQDTARNLKLDAVQSAESIAMELGVAVSRNTTGESVFASEVEDSEQNRTTFTLNILEKNYRAAKSRRASLASKLKNLVDDDSLRWAALIDKCVATRLNEYNYSICFFASAKQGSANLGTFNGWDPHAEHVMTFAHGHRCHGGPARSLKAQLVCGQREEIIDVSEPSRCTYRAEVATPCACGEEGLKRLEEQIKSIFGIAPDIDHIEL